MKKVNLQNIFHSILSKAHLSCLVQIVQSQSKDCHDDKTY